MKVCWNTKYYKINNKVPQNLYYLLNTGKIFFEIFGIKGPPLVGAGLSCLIQTCKLVVLSSSYKYASHSVGANYTSQWEIEAHCKQYQEVRPVNSPQVCTGEEKVDQLLWSAFLTRVWEYRYYHQFKPRLLRKDYKNLL